MNRSAVPSARRSGRSGPRGLTLVELLAVIAISALLVGLLLPAVQGAREAARRLQCGNNLKQLALALSAHSSQVGHFPAAAEHRVNQCTSGFSGGGLPSSFTDGQPAWSVRLLPFLEQQPLYDRFDFAQPFFGIMCFSPGTSCDINAATTPAQRVNLPLQQTPVTGFMCPSQPVAGTPMKVEWISPPSGSQVRFDDCGGLRSMYHGISGGGPDSEAHCYAAPWAGAILNSRTTPAAIRDGLSNTLLLGEGEVASDHLWSSGARGCTRCAEQGNTLSMQDQVNTVYTQIFGNAIDGRAYLRRSLRSKHPGAALGAMADGSVHVFGDETSVTVLQLLGKRADRQAVSWP
jgi:prepilin-type N-terminal cleavage/methylation domain-containing protein